MTDQSDVIGKLEFKLPEAQDHFQVAIDGHKWFSVVWDMDQMLRSKLSYENITKMERVVYQKIRDSLHESMEENKLSFD